MLLGPQGKAIRTPRVAVVTWGSINAALWFEKYAAQIQLCATVSLEAAAQIQLCATVS